MSAKAWALGELDRRQAELFSLCSQLIQIPSENPPGATAEIAAFVEKYLRERGIVTEVHEPRPGMPNVVGSLGDGRPNLVVATHLDEFPAGTGWSFPPFSGEVRDGRIFGRGAGDMRAGMAIALFVAGLLQESGARPGGRLTLAFASDEETGGTWGTQWLLANVPAVRGDACLIGESSGTWSVGVGEKGVLWLRLRASGVSGHAAYALGESAVEKILAVIRGAERLHGLQIGARPEVATLIRRQRRAAEQHWGRGTGRIADRVTMNVGAIQGGGQVNLIPADCQADVDFRLPPGLSTTALLRRLRLNRHRDTIADVLNRCESYVTSPRERIVEVVRANAQALCGILPLPVVRLGYTDGRFFRREGIPTVVYGPSVRRMGGPDESIEAQELIDVAKVHVGAVFDYLDIKA